ncbi:MAG: hypothetical protein HMLIMOIP_002709 [Candidatus Nitrosomirales archaeon]|jgi:hypothetical protein
MARSDPLGDFNRAGLEKCPYCFKYKPEKTIYKHMDACVDNPKNKNNNGGS